MSFIFILISCNRMTILSTSFGELSKSGAVTRITSNNITSISNSNFNGYSLKLGQVILKAYSYTEVQLKPAISNSLAIYNSLAKIIVQ